MIFSVFSSHATNSSIIWWNSSFCRQKEIYTIKVSKAQ
jgi:hypothetical protein